MLIQQENPPAQGVGGVPLSWLWEGTPILTGGVPPSSLGGTANLDPDRDSPPSR